MNLKFIKNKWIWIGLIFGVYMFSWGYSIATYKGKTAQQWATQDSKDASEYKRVNGLNEVLVTEVTQQFTNLTNFQNCMKNNVPPITLNNISSYYNLNGVAGVDPYNKYVSSSAMYSCWGILVTEANFK